MKKRLISLFVKISLTASVVVLIFALFLNLATLWSVGKIQNGGLVTSGYFSAIVGSGSMEPTVFVNDFLLVQGNTDYQVDDIITYVSKQGGLITHRIKEVSKNGYITQGDANNTPDDEVFQQRVLGRVVFVLPGVGGVIEALLSPLGIALLGCIVLLPWVIQWIRRDQSAGEPNPERGASKDAV